MKEVPARIPMSALTAPKAAISQASQPTWVACSASYAGNGRPT